MLLYDERGGVEVDATEGGEGEGETGMEGNERGGEADEDVAVTVTDATAADRDDADGDGGARTAAAAAGESGVRAAHSGSGFFSIDSGDDGGSQIGSDALTCTGMIVSTR